MALAARAQRLLTPTPTKFNVNSSVGVSADGSWKHGLQNSFTLDLLVPNVSVLLKDTVNSTPAMYHLLNWSICAKTLQNEDGVECLAISLMCFNKCSDWVWDCKAVYKITLKNQKGQTEKDIVQHIAKTKFSNACQVLPLQSDLFFKFLGYTTLITEENGFILDNGIHIQIEVTCAAAEPPTGLHFKEKSGIQSAFDSHRTAITTTHILRMLESGEGSDIVILTKDKVEVKAHRGILASRSDVFSTMFTLDMKERKTGKVNMKDMKASSLKALLRFIYTGDCSQMENLELKEVLELINAGEKYALPPELKKYCGYLLVERCSFQNALKLYQFTKKFGLDEVGEEIYNFAQNHLNDVWGELAIHATVATSDSEEEVDEEVVD